MTAVLAASDHFSINWSVMVPVVSAFGALLAAVFGFLRNRRADTITLYSSFVDDLHEEVTRLRSQYEEDRKSWAEERTSLVARNRELEDENGGLRAEQREQRSTRPPRKRVE